MSFLTNGLRRIIPVLCFCALTCPVEAKKEEPPPFPEGYKKAKAALLDRQKKKAEPRLIAAGITSVAAEASQGKREDVLKDARKLIKPHLRYWQKHRLQPCVAAIAAYGVLRIKNSSRDLHHLGQEKKSKTVPRAVRARALEAIARIADPKSHILLLEYLDSPKPDATARHLAVAAAGALKHYASVLPKSKYGIMKDFMGKWGNLWSAAGGAFMTSADAAQWWGATHVPMVHSFNTILGVRLESYPECEKWWRKNRKAVARGKSY